MIDGIVPDFHKPVSKNMIRKRIGKPRWFKRIARTARPALQWPEHLMPGRKSRKWAAAK